MFLGEYQHSLDAKGRVILPSKYREQLQRGCLITPGQDHCLYVFTNEEWESVSQRLTESRTANPRARAFTRFWFSGSIEEQPDKQGRIHIPEQLRTYAGLDKDVAIVGVGRRIEIWDREKWSSVKSDGADQYAALSDSDDDDFRF